VGGSFLKRRAIIIRGFFFVVLVAPFSFTQAHFHFPPEDSPFFPATTFFSDRSDSHTMERSFRGHPLPLTSGSRPSPLCSTAYRGFDCFAQLNDALLGNRLSVLESFVSSSSSFLLFVFSTSYSKTSLFLAFLFLIVLASSREAFVSFFSRQRAVLFPFLSPAKPFSVLRDTEELSVSALMSPVEILWFFEETLPVSLPRGATRLFSPPFTNEDFFFSGSLLCFTSSHQPRIFPFASLRRVLLRALTLYTSGGGPLPFQRFTLLFPGRMTGFSSVIL